LTVVAESFLAQGAAALKGGDRHQIVVNVDAETLRDGTAGRCRFEHGPSMSAETARQPAWRRSRVGGDDVAPDLVGSLIPVKAK
jgi:hypothetical protein